MFPLVQSDLSPRLPRPTRKIVNKEKARSMALPLPSPNQSEAAVGHKMFGTALEAIH